MAKSQLQRDAVKCLPYIRPLAYEPLDTESRAKWRETLLALDKPTVTLLVGFMEMGRDFYLCDLHKYNPSADSVYAKKKKVSAERWKDKSKEEMVDNILTKILLHHYMFTDIIVLGLNSDNFKKQQ